MEKRSADLAGKVAIVTGAGHSEGIGFATVRALAEAGAKVIMADLQSERLAASARILRDEGHEIAEFAVDIASEEGVVGLMDFVRRLYGRLDVLDNNAASQGQRQDGLLTDLAVDLWDEIMSVNARGTMLMCKHAVPLMIEGGGGSIVNISSGTAMAGDFFATAYACSKGAINTLTRYVATQFGSQGVRCNAISVGLVMTGALQAGMPAAMQNVFRDYNLTRSLGQPQDIAEMVAFLASDRSRFVTGQVLPVDGGIYAHVPSTVEISRMLNVASDKEG